MDAPLHHLSLSRQGGLLRVHFSGQASNQEPGGAFVEELHQVLDGAEGDADLFAIHFSGTAQHFCAAMESGFLADSRNAPGRSTPTVARYLAFLHRLVRSPKWILSMVEGRAHSCAIGLIAASDFVLCGPSASFNLSEMLQGFLPASVVPFLMRRIGFHKTYLLAVTARTFLSAEALQLGLADEVSENLEQSLERILLRAARVVPKARSLGKFSPPIRGHRPGSHPPGSFGRIHEILLDPQNRENPGVEHPEGQEAARAFDSFPRVPANPSPNSSRP
ncbi:MAG: enoyl-CoA hydratase/isomerase family protein [Spirochaetes bacterium]|nr:enoyl-CoA hydratase/isomerase family protein [Spirochaetota bacterium]